MNKAERMAMVSAARKSRHTRPAEPADLSRQLGAVDFPQNLHATVLGAERLALELRRGTEVLSRWTARRGRVDKARVWLINDGAATLASVWRAVFPALPMNLIWLQDELDRTLNGG